MQARDGIRRQACYRLPYGKGAKAQAIELPREGSLDIASADPRLPGLLISMVLVDRATSATTLLDSATHPLRRYRPA